VGASRHSIGYMQRRSCHALAARPIASFDGIAAPWLARREDHLLDIAEPVLAEENFVANEEGRRAESSALDRALRIGEQLRLDAGVLDQFAEPLGVETRLEQGGSEQCRRLG